jgi:DNA/RNA-binding domain of Phe-tRNA-synthetase-like protein
MSDPDLQRGWVDAELAEEFPELALWLVSVEGRSRRSPPTVRRRLRLLAGRINGGYVIHMRQDPIPWAYRVFWRQVGIDPDTDRTPVEALAIERLRAGGLPSRNLLDDALTIATLETGVPVLALDADRPLALLSGQVAEDRGVTRSTERIVLGSIQVGGVPLISVEEALWTVTEVLSHAG